MRTHVKHILMTIVIGSLLTTGAAFAQPADTRSSVGPQPMPADAKYVCPMETHPDRENPDERGAYFSAEPGTCPWCGMTLKPLDELAWARTRKAAGAADVAYTCPRHQHVFSQTPGKCPRCGADLRPFKAMYTCPNPKHAHVITTSKGKCPICGKPLAPFRGIWLDEALASANVPPTTQPAADAPYRCPLHPLVTSHKPGRCTICAMVLTPGGEAAGARADIETTHADREHAVRVPKGTKYVCPMKECKSFSDKAGECPVCGMKLKPIEDVAWARDLVAQATQPAGGEFLYVCPMHHQVKADAPGTCPICAMQLVRMDQYKEPHEAPDQVQQQLNHITEHYLGLQRLLASDNTNDITKHALGVASASAELLERLARAGLPHEEEIRQAVQRVQSAALKINGNGISDDRVHFVALSSALVALLDHLRPDPQRWPHLYIFHCPMSKGNWIQAGKETRNPYYGFQMLKCGELKAAK
jgi:rubrerythrin